MPGYKPQKEYCRLETYARFHKGEIILSCSDHPTRIGVLQEGEAHLSIADENGQEISFEQIHTGGCFGAYYLTLLPSHDAHVIADTRCLIMFVDLPKVLTGCAELCDHHQETMKNIIMLSAHHAQTQSIRINILGQRTLRDKLLVYLQYQQQYYTRGEEFQLPMNLSSLANFLAVDRSAMMRELKKMNEEGLLRSHGRYFTLL